MCCWEVEYLKGTIMNKRVITHVFAAVQNLEKSMAQVKDLLTTRPKEHAELQQIIPQQEEVLKKMRRTANRLQFELAREDWYAAIRSLRVFYGLNHLVRKDILGAQRRLAGTQQTPISAPAAAEPKEVIYH